MNDIDDLLKKTLGPETADALDDDGPLRDQLNQITEAFRGKSRVLSIAWLFEVLLFTVLGVICVVYMFRADDVRMTVIWSVAALGCGFTIGLMKIWFYMVLNRNRVLREVKRLELGLAMLSERLGRADG